MGSHARETEVNGFLDDVEVKPEDNGCASDPEVTCPERRRPRGPGRGSLGMMKLINGLIT